MGGPAEPQGVGAWRNLLRAHAVVVPRLERLVEAEADLSLIWYDVLLELNAASERRLRMQELARRVTLSRSRVSRVVDELAHAGLVERVPDPADGRAAFAALTPHGRAALRRAAPVYLRGIEHEFLAHLNPDERHAIEQALDKVIRVAERADAPD